MFKLILIIVAGGLTPQAGIDVSQAEYRFSTLELCQAARTFYLPLKNELVSITAACFKE
jgi:hypothetical protein